MFCVRPVFACFYIHSISIYSLGSCTAFLSSSFLVADTRLYTLPCPSVGRSVRHIFEFRAVFALLLLPKCMIILIITAPSYPHTHTCNQKGTLIIVADAGRANLRNGIYILAPALFTQIQCAESTQCKRRELGN